MKRLFILMVMAFCMIISANAVGDNTSKRVLAKSLDIEKKADEITVKKDGQAYTGIFWSNDAKTIQYKAENGKVVRTIVFYPNQKICYKKDGKDVLYYMSNGQHVARLSAKNTKYYKDALKNQGI